MNRYSIEYDSHSIFLREKSNEDLKRRLGSISGRRNNYLPEIKSNNKCITNSIANSPGKGKKKLSVMDVGK